MRNLTKSKILLLAAILFTVAASFNTHRSHSPIYPSVLLGATVTLLLSIYFFRKSRSKTKRVETVRFMAFIYLCEAFYLLAHFYVIWF